MICVTAFPPVFLPVHRTVSGEIDIMGENGKWLEVGGCVRCIPTLRNVNIDPEKYTYCFRYRSRPFRDAALQRERFALVF